MDSYRPGNDNSNRRMYRFGRDERHPPNKDSYRPGDFSFRTQTERAPRFDAGSTGRGGGRGREHAFRRSNPDIAAARRRRDAGGPRGRAGRFSKSKPKARVAERPLLRHSRSPTPEQYEGMSIGVARFKPLEELDNSLDADMGRTDNEPPRKKTHRFAREDGSSIPKWSNPDPYTALPPPEEVTGVRTDVVSLIRRAKSDIAASKLIAGKDEDFISFDADDGVKIEQQESESDSSRRTSSRSSTPKRFSHLDNLHPDRYAPGVTDRISNSESLGAPPPPPPEISKGLLEGVGPVSALDGTAIDVWPPPPRAKENPKPAKRHHDAIAERFDIAADDDDRGSNIATRRKFMPPGFELDGQWRSRSDEINTPWCRVDHSETEHVGHRLHKELCDYYDFLKPQRWENEMRQDLVHRTTQAVRTIFGSSTEVRYFGSFAAGVYLPNSDMDLVILSREFRDRRIRLFGTKKYLFKFSSYIQNSNRPIAKPGSVATIAGARVPIVKYVDRLTGLRVDVSFENDTGVIANNTYAQWTAQYPAMPILVTLIKQFLQMRDLNDVSTGGLGGFSTTCLVVSLLQHLPQVQSGNMTQLSNLGELFMCFLDFYGNKFNLETTGIQLSPPGYFLKHKSRIAMMKKPRPFSLCMIDPNNDDNDLTGGTRHSRMIIECFAYAHQAMQERMSQVQYGDMTCRKGSLLAPLYAGSYALIESQRTHLRRLHRNQ